MNDNKVHINILILLVKALASNPRLYKEIDSLYNINKETYNEYAKRHEYYNSRFFREGRVEIEIYSLKVLGMISYSVENKDDDIYGKLYGLLKKSYRKLYNYVKAKGEKVYISDCKKQFDELTLLPTSEFILSLGAFYFFVQELRKEFVIDTVAGKEYINIFKQYVESFQNNSCFQLPEGKENILKEVKAAQRKKFGAIRSLVDYSVQAEHYKNNKLYEFLEATCSLESMGFDALEYIKFSEREIDEILRYFIAYFYPDIQCADEVDLEELHQAFILSLTFRSCFREYNHAKKIIVDKTTELTSLEESKKLAVQIRKMKEKISELNQIRLRQTEELNSKQLELEKAYKLLDRQDDSDKKDDDNAEKDNEINRLQQEIQRLLDDNSKIGTLDDVRDKKAAVVGGRPKQLKKLHAQYENFIFIDAGERNLDLRCFQSIELIVIFYNYLSHNVYDKILKYARQNNIRIVYLSSLNQKIYF